MSFIEEVNGTIIGGFAKHYAFWTTKPVFPCYLPPYRFAGRSFDNDEEAEAWVRQHYPAEYAAGVEMRCYD